MPTNDEIIAALKDAGTISGAAEQLGCSRGLLERRAVDDAKVRRALKKANKGAGAPRLVEGERTVQVLLQVPESLRTTFDREWKRLGYANRSEAAREILRDWLG